MLLPPRPTHFPYTTLFRSAVPRIRRDRQSGHSRLGRDFAHAHADVVLAFSADGSGFTQSRPIQSGMRAQLPMVARPLRNGIEMGVAAPRLHARCSPADNARNRVVVSRLA